MPVRIFTITFDPQHEVFQDEELRAFLLNKRVNTLHPEFFQANGKAYWSVFTEYETVLSADPQKNDGLNAPQKLLYQRLREWRKETAEKEGIPAYIIANNSQIAEVVMRAPRSLEALRQIHGFGKKKVERYGKTILEIINDFYEKKPAKSS